MRVIISLLLLKAVLASIAYIDPNKGIRCSRSSSSSSGGSKEYHCPRAYKKLPWDEANDYCLDHYGSTLATIWDNKMTRDFKNIVREHHRYGERVWIGLNDLDREREWKFVDGYECRPRLGWRYRSDCPRLNWAPGEPNNLGNEDCAEAFCDRGDIYLNDQPCRDARAFMCNPASDAACTSFSDSSNDRHCNKLSENWNLGIAIADSKYASSSSSIMFSYCIDNACSNWYKLDYCGRSDFARRCMFHHFIIPHLSEDMENLLSGTSYKEVKFEFKNCGKDALVIDQIKIGHQGEFGYIDGFEGAVCMFKRWKSEQRTFVLDGNGDCPAVSVLANWNVGDTQFGTTSTISDTVTTALNCKMDPGCTSKKDNCQLKGVQQDGSCSIFTASSNDCARISNEWNVAIGTAAMSYSGTKSLIAFSYCIDGDCSDWYRLDNCGHKDWASKCDYEYFIIPQLNDDMKEIFAQNTNARFSFEFKNCGSDLLLVDQIKIGHNAEFGIIDTFSRGDDGFCTVDGPDEEAVFKIDNGCSTVSVQINWSGTDATATDSTIYSSLTSTDEDMCKNPGLGCAGKDVGFNSLQCEVQVFHPSPDATCKTFRDSTNDCDEIKTDWNLQIGVGGHKHAGTDTAIMFSYCINSICSNWYILNNCKHNDFKKCRYEYFMVPQFGNDIQNALDQGVTDFRFEFYNCGGDGLLIDEIGIGHHAEFGNIYTFEGDHSPCRFSGSYNNEKSFAVDNDRCTTVSIEWHGDSSTSSNIWSVLSQTVPRRKKICKIKKSECAGDANYCQVQTPASLQETVPYILIGNKTIFGFGGFIVLLLVLSIWNTSKCWRHKYNGHSMKVKYQNVSVESSVDEEC